MVDCVEWLAVLNGYEKQLKKGDTVIFAAFGGGFSWGSIYMKWAYTKIKTN